MESYIENVRKLSENPKELAIVKHYAMKFMNKKKWSNMVRNRKFGFVILHFSVGVFLF